MQTKYTLVNKASGYDENVLTLQFAAAFITVVTATQSVRFELVDGVPTSDTFEIREGEAENVYSLSPVVEETIAEPVAEEVAPAAADTAIEEEVADVVVDASTTVDAPLASAAGVDTAATVSESTGTADTAAIATGGDAGVTAA